MTARFDTPWLLLACLAASAPARADPMRPLTPPPQSMAPPASSAAGDIGSAPSASEEMPLMATRRVEGGDWQALLGERWVRTGELINGARVLQIGPDRVVLLRAGQRDTLQWLPILQAPTAPVPHRAKAPVAKRP